MSEQLSERGKDLVKYMPQAVNALADLLAVRLEERLLYGEKPQTKADVVEVVRCKNCRWRTEADSAWHPCTDMQTQDNWFCGDGEAK